MSFSELKTNCLKCRGTCLSKCLKYSDICLVCQCLRVLRRMVLQISNRSPSMAFKKGISSHYFDACIPQWESVLKLSTLYEMAKVKAFSVEKMTPLLIESPTRQIYLSKTYDIKEWLALGVVRLANRTRPIDEEDVKIVGISDALKVCALREKRVQCGTCKARKNWGFEMKEVGEMFGICDTDLPSVVEGCEKCCNCSDDGPFFGQTSTTGGGGLFGRR
ncbi:hypothetical protein AX15_001888 [Amanita polypyramis BW_CC]|nr:hypothetical protein AX15_001888 [Amanita polypyramis BW_CC]